MDSEYTDEHSQKLVNLKQAELNIWKRLYNQYNQVRFDLCMVEQPDGETHDFVTRLIEEMNVEIQRVQLLISEANQKIAKLKEKGMI